MILSFLILIGSVLQVRGSLVELETYSSDSTREIEILGQVGFVFTAFSLFLDEDYPRLNLKKIFFEFISTVPQLLISHRITLPPPVLN